MFYSLFEKSPLPMWLFDVDTLRFLDVNIAATKHYGYTRDEFLKMTIKDIRPEEDIPALKKLVKLNAKTGSFLKKTFRHLKKDGSLIYVNVESNPIDFGGKKARLVLINDITERLLAEQTLMLSEQRFKALVQDGSDMIAIMDIDLNYLWVSPTSLRQLGVPHKTLVGHNALEFIHRDDQELVFNEAAKLNASTYVQFSPFRFKNLNGDWRWIETRATNLIDDAAVGGIVCNSRDVTERINSERKIRENVERYNIVSKATSDIIWDYDIQTSRVLWNRGISGILKYKNIGEITNINWWRNNIHPEDSARVLASFDRHVKEGITRWEQEYRFLCGDGDFKYIADRGFIVVDKGGKANRMIGAMQDISKRKEEEHWSKLLESVVINTTDGVMITDSESETGPAIVYVNNALIKMSGYSRAELIGSSPHIFHGSDTAQKGLKQIEKALKDKKPCNIELTNYTKQGMAYDVSINISPVTDSTGKVTHWISIQRDITENRKYVKAIEEQNKRLKDIGWIQSHLVREPLTRIMSLVELLQSEPLTDDQKTLLDYLSRSAADLDEVVNAITRNVCKD